MATLTGFLSLIGLAAVGYMLHAFAILSARLGAVTKMPARYRLFWGGVAGVGLGAIGRLLMIAGLVDSQDPIASVMLFLVPLALGLSASLYAAWYYWRWLFRE